jgi:hypothetical protein
VLTLPFQRFRATSEESFPKLLLALCKEAPRESLGNQQALAKQLADVFDFVLRFDDAKVHLFPFSQGSSPVRLAHMASG